VEVDHARSAQVNRQGLFVLLAQGSGIYRQLGKPCTALQPYSPNLLQTTDSETASTPAMSSFNPSIFSLPFSSLPSNSHPSDTLDKQAETERIISQLLQTTPPAAGDGETIPGGTTLRKAEHAGYFQHLLFRLPPGFVSLDASKPWLMYWTVHSLDILGIALDQGTKDRYVHPILQSSRYSVCQEERKGRCSEVSGGIP
jgi:hypothetical protein